MIFKSFILTGALSAWLVTGGLAEAQAQQLSPRQYEHQVKATFIYNFSRFVEWPAGAFRSGRGSLTICILGDNPFGGALDLIKGKIVKDKKIEIKHLTNASKLDICQILFVSSSEKERLTSILESARHSSVLTIGEMSQFTQAGGVVALTMRKSRIYFSVNLDAADETGVKISSRVLRLATVVNYNHQEERR